MSIYVGNLSYDVTREDIEDVFNEYGRVSRVSLPPGYQTIAVSAWRHIYRARYDR